MNNNLVALRAQDISPEIVMQGLQMDIENIEEIFVVTLGLDGPKVYAAGDIANLAFAALCLQDLALKSLNGGEDEA